MSGGWGDRFDPPCTKTNPHPRHTWGTGTCPGITDPDTPTSQQPRDDATSFGGSMRPMQTPGQLDRAEPDMPPSLRDALIALCEAAAVPEARWTNRDSAGAQAQVGRAWALLRAGCHFTLSPKPLSDERTWWICVHARGFNWFEGGLEPDRRDELLDDDLFYIPTAERLKGVDGGDWY